MRIHCHFPVTLRIVGVPTDDQLAAIGRTLVRAVSARLADAERVLADRHAIAPPGPARIREGAPAVAGGSDARPDGDRSVFPPPEPEADRAAFRLVSADGDDARRALSTVDATVALPVASGRAPQAELLGRRARGPRVERFDAGGLRQQEERSQMLARGGNPHLPVPRLPDPLADALREARRTAPPPPVPEPILPGDRAQQRRAIERVDPADLWLLPRVQEAMRRMAEYMQRWEQGRRRPNSRYDAAYWMDVWRERFTTSVQYILYYRGFGRGRRRAANMRAWHLEELAAAERDLLRRYPPPTGHAGAAEETALWAMGLGQHVEAGRAAARAAWLADIDWAVDEFIVLTDNQAKFLTVPQKADPVLVKGLPSFERVVPPAAARDQLEDDSVGSAESVVTFMRAVQRHWSGRKVKAGNYPRHELDNPHFGNVDFLGKYSFDVSLGDFVTVGSDGFYDHDETVEFFRAVERASVETHIGWLAWYNDFSVAKQVNEEVGEFRIGFSGGGSPANAPPERQGSLHHGPAPYILHIHFNIMVRQDAAMLLRDRDAQGFNLGYTGDE